MQGGVVRVVFFVKDRCTDSILVIFVTVRGDHTGVAYLLISNEYVFLNAYRIVYFRFVSHSFECASCERF